jgi:cytochrome c oxidase subunit 3
MTTRINSVQAFPAAPSGRLPDAVLGVVLLVVTEIMFFAALMSAHTIARASAAEGVWPPVGQPRLPLEQTAVNTVALLLSGVLLWIGNRYLQSERTKALRLIAVSIGLGVVFVLLQGKEWVALLREGLTLTSSSLGSYFYLIVGTHALHVLAGILAMIWAYRGLKRGMEGDAFTAVRLFWYFVVVLWPGIYLKVYL